MDHQRMFTGSGSPDAGAEKKVAWEPVTGGLVADAADTQFGRSIKDSDLAVVTKALSRLDMVLPEGPFLLFVGVGVGNPSSAWGNPSNNPSLDMGEQRKPLFLADALARGFKVVSITFNVRQGAEFELRGNRNQAFLDIGVPCPLVMNSDADTRAVEALAMLSGRADLFTVMNSVSQIRYPALVSLVNRRMSRKPGERLASSYLSSYGETGARFAIAPIQARLAVRRSSALRTLDDVLPRLEDLDL